MHRFRRSLRLPLFAAVTVVAGGMLAGCAKDAPQDLFRPAGENARNIDEGLGGQRYLFYLSGVVTLIVFGVIGYILIKYKDRGQDTPEQTHGNPKLEIALTVLPAIILATIAVPTVVKIFELDDRSDTQCVVNVTGQQWWWEYEYPAGMCGDAEITEPIITSGELVIPADTDVLLRLTSRDVIHSFWIPRLNGKRDAVPGRTHTLRMQADQPGLFTGQCTEFCGLSHARMRQAAVALDATDFQTWVDNQLAAYTPPAADSVAADGEATFIAQCSRCHQVNDLSDGGEPVVPNPAANLVSGSAPNLSKLMTRTAFAGWTFDLISEKCRDRLWNAAPEEFGAMYLKGVTPECFDEAGLRAWLRNPPAMKPMFVDPNNLDSTGGLYRGMPNLGLTEAQIDELIAYLSERK